MVTNQNFNPFDPESLFDSLVKWVLIGVLLLWFISKVLQW